jgi:hypothetical protein
MNIDDVPRAAARQGGVFTSGQAQREGWTPRQIRRRLAAGRWSYVAGWALARTDLCGKPWTAFQLAIAAWLTIPTVVSSHWTAALLHGFPVESPETKCAHVTSGARIAPGRSIVVHNLRLADHEIARYAANVRITSKERTALDLLSIMPLSAALDLWAWVSSRKILDPAGLEAAISRRRRWRGRPQLQQILQLVGSGAVSGAEFLLHQLLREAGIEGWTAGVTIADAEGVIAVVDVRFDGTRVVIEIDGFRAHSSKASFINDRRRQNRLIAADYRVLRYTWDDLRNRPQEVIAEIRAALLRDAAPGAALFQGKF